MPDGAGADAGVASECGALSRAALIFCATARAFGVALAAGYRHSARASLGSRLGA
jgi:hypothetical protein